MGNGCIKPKSKNTSQVYTKLKNIEMILLEEEGLDNMGNSCYINSVFQSLVMFDNVFSYKNNKNNKKPISKSIKQIFNKLKTKQAQKCNTNIKTIKEVSIIDILNIVETE